MNQFSISRATTKDKRLLCKLFINHNHSYIKWSDRPSRKLYWLLHENEELVGVFGLGSGFVRPKVISLLMTEKNISFNEIGNNIVFCMSGQIDKNAGSKLLSLVRRDAKKWWKERYGDNLKLLQTFILPPRTGSVYKADNWKYIGDTSGVSQITKTIRISNVNNTDKVITKVFNDGSVRYLTRSMSKTDVKLIFIKEM